jgi:NAD(P)-dependent dehydrogenase (short-subunit alcohol dehydrogenase family)
MARAFVDGMIARGGGSIVNIVSIAGTNASPAVGSYTPSKAGLLALTRLMAVEWGPLGVRCNAVGPGLIPTEGAGVYGDPEVKAARAAAIPVGRLGTPLDIANAVAFFASEQSSYVNGQALFVDGGLTQSLMTFLPRPKGVAGPQLKK